MRCVTRRSNSSVVSVCWPVIMSSIGSRTMLRLGAVEPLLDSVDSILARNDGSLPVCATRLSVASAAAFSKVSGSFDGVQAAISAARKGRAGRRRNGRRAVADGGRSFALPLEVAGFVGGDPLERSLLQDLGAAGLPLGGGRRRREVVRRARGARRRGRRGGARRRATDGVGARGRRRGSAVAGVAAAAAAQWRGGRGGRSRPRRGGGRAADGLGAPRRRHRRRGRRCGDHRPRRLAGLELQRQRGDADQRAGAGDQPVEGALAEQLA